MSNSALLLFHFKLGVVIHKSVSSSQVTIQLGGIEAVGLQTCKAECCQNNSERKHIMSKNIAEWEQIDDKQKRPKNRALGNPYSDSRALQRLIIWTNCVPSVRKVMNHFYGLQHWLKVLRDADEAPLMFRRMNMASGTALLFCNYRFIRCYYLVLHATKTSGVGFVTMV